MMTEPLTPIAIQLARNPHGRLVLTLADGSVHEGVTPVRAFPIAAPDDGVSLLNGDGPELAFGVGQHQAAKGVTVQLKGSGRAHRVVSCCASASPPASSRWIGFCGAADAVAAGWGASTSSMRSRSAFSWRAWASYRRQ